MRHHFRGQPLELSGINMKLRSARVRAIREAAQKYFSEPVHGSSEHEWVGMRPLAPDALPVIGALPESVAAETDRGHSEAAPSQNTLVHGLSLSVLR